MIEEFYKKINGNYEEAILRMQDDEKIKKFLKFFLMDTSYNELEEAIKNEDCEKAFIGAHTLKGVCKNMAFTELSLVVEEITEELRMKNFEKAKDIFPNVSKEYQKVINEINQII